MTVTHNPDFKQLFKSSHRKEGKVYFEQYAAIVNDPQYDEGFAVVDLRIYSTGWTVTACLWVHGKKARSYHSGSGSAGGYGYHKPSAAAAEAIHNAGYKLSEDISGRGDEVIKKAVRALADLAGYPEAIIFKAHQ